MKERPIENLRSKIIFVSLAIISSFLLIINFIPIFVVNAGITTEFTEDLDADRETYVNQSSPDMNYANSNWGNAVIGNSCVAFVHFNLELLSKETEELYFVITRYDHGPKYWLFIEDIEINVILVESNWKSSEITWNNKPKHGEIIDTVNISEIRQGYVIEYYNLEKAINLTKIFKNNQLNEISLSINITENNLELNASVYLYRIQLLWNYEKLLLSYTTIISTFIVFFMLIGTLYFFRKDVYYCKNCSAKRNLTNRCCSSCGTEIKKDIIIKGYDYQLVLILLWIITFFAIPYLIIMFLYNWDFFFYYPIIIALLLVPWAILFYKQLKKRIRQYKELRLYLKKI